MYIIVITHSSYAISYINVLNDLCLCIKRLYTSHFYNATPYYRSNEPAAVSFRDQLYSSP